MSTRVYNRTNKLVGALAKGAHVIVPAGDARQPGYADVSPKVAMELVAQYPDQLGLDYRAAKQEQGIYEPGFKTEHFEYLENLSESNKRTVLEFLSYGNEKYKKSDHPEDWITDRIKKWMVGEPENINSPAEKAVKKAAAKKAEKEKEDRGLLSEEEQQERRDKATKLIEEKTKSE